MAEGVTSRVWGMRILFVFLCLSIIFFKLMPFSTAPQLWAGPNLMVVLCMAWAARQPDYTPAWLVAILFLLEDFLLMRPPGLGAFVMVLAVEVQRKRAPTIRDATFVSEWATAAALMVAIALGARLVLMMFFVDRPSLGLTLIQAMMNVAAYPLVVLLSQVFFGVRRQAARDGQFGAAS
ncbi:rod shape-determining protein MreD [Shimia isoporae]|uniref:Rod shape-determining protein MreD n=1 Tax=Shimia isoporae TaxID=647720 RepID=A0A4R1N0D7_9RHOB|nr:rod shape-determining protein MreD [Shimia isoporae]TCK98945.1 rod shape-determining protein MreD [Shimia isoporae]